MLPGLPLTAFFTTSTQDGTLSPSLYSIVADDIPRSAVCCIQQRDFPSAFCLFHELLPHCASSWYWCDNLYPHFLCSSSIRRSQVQGCPGLYNRIRSCRMTLESAILSYLRFGRIQVGNAYDSKRSTSCCCNSLEPKIVVTFFALTVKP